MAQAAALFAPNVIASQLTVSELPFFSERRQVALAQTTFNETSATDDNDMASVASTLAFWFGLPILSAAILYLSIWYIPPVLVVREQCRERRNRHRYARSSPSEAINGVLTSVSNNKLKDKMCHICKDTSPDPSAHHATTFSATSAFVRHSPSRTIALCVSNHFTDARQPRALLMATLTHTEKCTVCHYPRSSI